MTNTFKKGSILFRSIAKLIDFIIVLFIWSIFSDAGLLAGILYLLISDGVFKGKSIGKKLMGLKVINTEKEKAVDFRDSIMRNLIVALSLFFFKIPLIGWLLFFIVYAFEFILIIGDSESKRLGDYLAKTYVIDD